ncbi:MAG: ChrR family anti-sigma-E factor [Pseudomonadota bacterium]
MTAKHTLPEKLMLSYAAGTLPEAFDLVIASHLSLCDESRIGVEAYEAIGGTIIEKEIPVSMSPGALDRCFGRLDGQAPRPKSGDAVNAVFPKPLRDMIGGDIDTVNWRSIGRGVKQAIIETEGRATVRLLSIPGGVEMPEHGHQGMEVTLVLQGAFKDGQDRFARGDIEVATDDMDHQPVAEDGDVCICLAATENPLRFNSFVPKLLQPLFRI